MAAAARGGEPDDGAAARVPRLVHCFTSSRAALDAYVARGCYIGVTGYLLKVGVSLYIREKKVGWWE